MNIKEFKNYIYASYNQHYRSDMIWRNDPSGYNIFISEIMLQQTQVSRVKEYFKKWTELFPDFFSLSIAKKEDVLIAWQGLGYNRRALYLFESAKIITDKYNGVIPRNREALLSLPGIGSYTSGALLIFTYNLPEIIIETNIRTVYLKYFFNNIINVSDKEIFPLIEATMDYENPRYWYYLLMDIGFYIKQTEKNWFFK